MPEAAGLLHALEAGGGGRSGRAGGGLGEVAGELGGFADGVQGFFGLGGAGVDGALPVEPLLGEMEEGCGGKAFVCRGFEGGEEGFEGGGGLALAAGDEGDQLLGGGGALLLEPFAEAGGDGVVREGGGEETALDVEVADTAGGVAEAG